MSELLAPLEWYTEKRSVSELKQRDVVGDLFLGSGTTLISCEQTWRQCRGIELDPRYIDVSINRWVKYMESNSLDFEVRLNGKTIEWEL